MKGMTFDHDFGYSFPLFPSLLKKEGRRKVYSYMGSEIITIFFIHIEIIFSLQNFISFRSYRSKKYSVLFFRFKGRNEDNNLNIISRM